MTLKEVREMVAESNHREFLGKLSLNIPYAFHVSPVQLKGFTEIFRFFLNQSKDWQKLGNQLPNQLKKVQDHFRDSVSKIETYIPNIENRDTHYANKSWIDLQRQIMATQFGSDIKVLTTELPQLDFLLEIQEEYSQSFGGAYDYLIWKRVNNSNFNNSGGLSAAYFKGLTLAYEFELQDHTNLVHRRNNEKRSIAQIRAGFENKLSEAEANTQEYFNKSQDTLDQHLNSLDELKERKEEWIDEWFKKTQLDFNEFYHRAKQTVKTNEVLYIDKLRLAAPVQFWKERADDMRKDGRKWAIWFGITLILAASSLFVLLWLVPEEMTAALFRGEAQAIKWTLLYVTFISFLAYGVRTFAKLTFSSYHLARDAEEREQLTHVYLALKKDGNVEEEDRLIILQSLFSRAETGLLKDDSSPTMPGTALERLTGIK